jgi:hypothetical protein
MAGWRDLTANGAGKPSVLIMFGWLKILKRRARYGMHTCSSSIQEAESQELLELMSSRPVCGTK